MLGLCAELPLQERLGGGRGRRPGRGARILDVVNCLPPGRPARDAGDHQRGMHPIRASRLASRRRAQGAARRPVGCGRVHLFSPEVEATPQDIAAT
jgi:hypothetical protein